jgi:hypothetical protein
MLNTQLKDLFREVCSAWTAASPFGLSLDPDAQKRPAALRRNIAKAVRLLSEYEIEGG